MPGKNRFLLSSGHCMIYDCHPDKIQVGIFQKSDKDADRKHVSMTFDFDEVTYWDTSIISVQSPDKHSDPVPPDRSEDL